MFLISSPITAAFPSSSSTMVNSCAQAASAAGHSGTELFNLTALKALKKLSISSVGSASSCGSSGLRRTVSSLHGMPEMCSHQEDLSKCIVQAKQVEMDFESTSSQPFYVTVKAPNGELSRRLDFNEHSRSVSFTPKRGGCGHGDWTITVHQLDGGKVVKKVRETINLDGVGTLFFAVDDQMQLRLKSQEFLRLPSASQCCSSRKHA